ncbi:TPA: hypothetical protein ACGP52_002678 [Escherichia coli]
MKNIGVIGCLPELPVDFPLLMPENSGNMIHAEAPLRMFPRAVHYKDSRFILSGETSFRNFVNKTCSHLIITLANSLSLESQIRRNIKGFLILLSSMMYLLLFLA